ncbi:substrate-binding periplasmic protein [Psychrobacter jeotgali]|uniref:substrate-binding periplasmic protein n=1 Tax=Psychrobacter jeotgali TaxID=179010 RepID=UPI001919C665|nr:transporter substrate-binding domain-containing protein [Psychrobacter jeotgali]
MKYLYRVLPLALSVGLFGCGSPSTQDNATGSATTAPTENKEDFVSQLPASAPVVKLSADANYAPYGFKDEYGNVTGFDIELMRHLGEDQGFRVEVYSDLWKDAFDNIDNKSRDLIAAGASYSDARASKYLTSDSYLPLPTSIVYLDEALNIGSLSDLSNVSVGVLGESVQYNYFTQGDFNVQSVEPYPTIFLAVQAMAQGKIDAVAGDLGVMRYIMNDLPTLEPKFFDYESLDADNARKVIYIDKDQPELLEKVNSGLKSLKENGTYATLTTKWFGEDLTQKSLEQQEMLKSASGL